MRNDACWRFAVVNGSEKHIATMGEGDFAGSTRLERERIVLAGGLG